ncbi:MAG: hypothetical protein M3Z31_11940 [Pseudomonadota bacterium]|nr:hypothetical protein [Pseudomonadota bacterium]
MRLPLGFAPGGTLEINLLYRMPDWHTGEWLHNCICDVAEEAGSLHRVPFAPYVEALRKWQRTLNRVTVLDEDPFSDPVELQDIVDAAHRLRLQPDKDWS